MTQKHFFVIGGLFDYHVAMCADLIGKENVSFTNQYILVKSKFWRFVQKVHCSGALNKYIQMPLRDVRYRYIFDYQRVAWGGVITFCFSTAIPMCITLHS